MMKSVMPTASVCSRKWPRPMACDVDMRYLRN